MVRIAKIHASELTQNEIALLRMVEGSKSLSPKDKKLLFDLRLIETGDDVSPALFTALGLAVLANVNLLFE